MPALHAVGNVSTKAINRARLKASAQETNYIEVVIHDDMSTGAVSRRAIARFQATLDAEALVTVPAFSAAASPQHALSKLASRAQPEAIAACIDIAYAGPVSRFDQ